jgi:hypothetical protein
MLLGTLGRAKLDGFFHGRVEGIFGHTYVYGNEKTTEYQNILGMALFSIAPSSSI